MDLNNCYCATNNNKEITKSKSYKFNCKIRAVIRKNHHTTRCQNYGHTKNFCTRQPRYMKCTKHHLTWDAQEGQEMVMLHVSTVKRITQQTIKGALFISSYNPVTQNICILHYHQGTEA